MANNNFNRYIGAIALGTLLAAMPGCTDTWDDHYNANESVSGTTKTLWDVINDPENSQYSRFRDIVKKAKYYKDDTHAVSTYSYEDILKGGQVNTVWVPDNSVLTEAEYNKWMNMLAEAESRADEGGRSNAGYNVQQQFIGNHIALWRHNISEPGVDTVKMINGKNLEFDKTRHTLEGIPLGEYNIPTANGVMHVLKGIAPFRYNFYEYLKFRDPMTDFGKYVVGKDTTYFMASRSIEGLPDENGNPTYVDSVYVTSNRLFGRKDYLPAEGAEKWQMREYGFGAAINNEDSVFVVLMPTDAAWNAACEMLSESHKYASFYEDKDKGDLNSPTAINILKPDSLKEKSIAMDLVSPLVFNIHKQPKRGGSEMWTLDMFKTYKGDGGNPNSRDDYLLNTFGDTLRNVGGWNKTSLFEGEPIEMSNGIAYEVSSWNFPKEFYTPDVEVEIENSGIFYNITKTSEHKLGVASKRFSFSNESYKDITSLYGKVSNGNFYHFAAPGPTAVPKAYVKLKGNNANAYVPDAQVMSGKYDIQIVVVPHWYIDIANEGAIDEKFYKKDTLVVFNEETGLNDSTLVPTTEIDTSYVKSLAAINKYKVKGSVYYTNGSKEDKKTSKTIEYNGLKVDTLTLFEDFEFPYSYKNMRFSYPTIYIEGATGKNDAKPDKNGEAFVFDLVIDKIILKRK